MKKFYCDMCGRDPGVLGGVLNTFYTEYGRDTVWTFTICPRCAVDLEEYIEQRVKVED